MPISPECQLLCASMVADSLADDGTIDRQSPYFGPAGFVGDGPVGLVGGGDTINACLVGSTAGGVVVAFRGTLSFEGSDPEQALRDWINDLDAELVRAGTLPGLVHAGFWGSLDSLWAQLVPEVQKRLAQDGPNRELYVTGHSKGAAVASLAAMRFLIERGLNARVDTYAAPHPGNQDFATAYGEHLPQSTRYEYADDIVPHLPPSLAFRQMFASVPFMKPYVGRLDVDYSAVGTLQYITKAGKIVPDSSTLRFERYLSLAKLIAAGEFGEIIKDHNGGCGGGYMSALCPQGVCP